MKYWILFLLQWGLINLSFASDRNFDFGPSYRISGVEYANQMRSIWKTRDPNIFYYAPLGLPELISNSEEQLCIRYFLNNEPYLKSVKEEINNYQLGLASDRSVQQLRPMLPPITEMYIELYDTRSIKRNVVAKYIFQKNEAKEFTNKKICFPTIEKINPIHLESRLSLVTEVDITANSQCKINTIFNNDFNKIIGINSEGESKVLTEKQLNKLMEIGHIKFNMTCYSSNIDKSDTPVLISDIMKNALIEMAKKQLDTEQVRLDQLHTKLSNFGYNTINAIPNEKINSVKSNSMGVTTKEEVNKKLGDIALDAILTHNKKMSIFRPSSKAELNTKETVDTQSNTDTRAIVVPANLQLYKITSLTKDKLFLFNMEEAVRLSSTGKVIDEINMPFLRNGIVPIYSEGHDDYFPSNVILPFYGNTEHLPDNWKICDGNNYINSSNITVRTPNLQGAFLKGANNTVKKLELITTGKNTHDHKIPTKELETSSAEFFSKGNHDLYSTKAMREQYIAETPIPVFNFRIDASVPSMDYGPLIPDKVSFYSRTVEISPNEPKHVEVFFICRIE